MKNTILTAFLLLSLAGNAQKGTHTLSLGLSNNGQLSAAMTDYYFVYFYTLQVPEYRRVELKANLTYSYTTATGREFGMAAGFGRRTENYDEPFFKTDISQNYVSAMPFFLKNWDFKHLQVAAGGGIPCYRIGDYNALLVGDSLGARMRITGGGAIGISGLVRLKWNFTERFSLSGLVNFGVLYMHYGKDYVFDNYDADGNLTGTATAFHRQNRGLIPAPELSLSIGFRI